MSPAVWLESWVLTFFGSSVVFGYGAVLLSLVFYIITDILVVIRISTTPEERSGRARSDQVRPDDDGGKNHYLRVHHRIIIKSYPPRDSDAKE